MSEERKDIEIVSGDGSELNISPVYEHISAGKPKPTEHKEGIVIPEVKKKNEKKEVQETEEEQQEETPSEEESEDNAEEND